MAGETGATSLEVRAALRELYEATGGAGWTNNYGWLNGSPCTGGMANWHDPRCGVARCGGNGCPAICCNEDGTIHKVMLPLNNLRGTLPASLFSVLALTTRFDLHSNFLSGVIPSELACCEVIQPWDQHPSIWAGIR